MKVDHILALARVKIKEKEKEKLEKEFSAILNFVEKLKEVNIQNVKPMSYPMNLQNVFRDDKLSKEDDLEGGVDKLLKLAPSVENRRIRVKQVL
ncbi:MAG: Asp-tRNA(Asn)/Glu-tRNA(Gln) amidotransferase subunit GatC [Patescibacteria group bacterium]